MVISLPTKKTLGLGISKGKHRQTLKTSFQSYTKSYKREKEGMVSNLSSEAGATLIEKNIEKMQTIFS